MVMKLKEKRRTVKRQRKGKYKWENMFCKAGKQGIGGAYGPGRWLEKAEERCLRSGWLKKKTDKDLKEMLRRQDEYRAKPSSP